MTTTIVTRKDKGSALTHGEMDQNLENLRDATDDHESATGTAVHGATTNPAAGAIPAALGDGTLDPRWIPLIFASL